MLSGVRIYATDAVWRQILNDLNATVLDAPTITDLNFDDLNVTAPVSAMELKSMILVATDYGDIIRRVFGRYVALAPLQARIIVLLDKAGAMSMTDLKRALGYAPDAATHAVDTAIYQLRKTYGRNFIKNEKGVYKIGEL